MAPSRAIAVTPLHTTPPPPTPLPSLPSLPQTIATIGAFGFRFVVFGLILPVHQNGINVQNNGHHDGNIT